MEVKGLFDYFGEVLKKWCREVVMGQWFNDIAMGPPIISDDFVVDPPTALQNGRLIFQINQYCKISFPTVKSFTPVTVHINNPPTGVNLNSERNEVSGILSRLHAPSLERFDAHLHFQAKNIFGKSQIKVPYQVEGAPTMHRHISLVELRQGEIIPNFVRSVVYFFGIPIPSIHLISGSLPAGITYSFFENHTSIDVRYAGGALETGTSTATFRASNRHGSIDAEVTFNVTSASSE